MLGRLPRSEAVSGWAFPHHENPDISLLLASPGGTDDFQANWEDALKEVALHIGQTQPRRLGGVFFRQLPGAFYAPTAVAV